MKLSVKIYGFYQNETGYHYVHTTGTDMIIYTKKVLSFRNQSLLLKATKHDTK